MTAFKTHPLPWLQFLPQRSKFPKSRARLELSHSSLAQKLTPATSLAMCASIIHTIIITITSTLWIRYHFLRPPDQACLWSLLLWTMDEEGVGSIRPTMNVRILTAVTTSDSAGFSSKSPAHPANSRHHLSHRSCMLLQVLLCEQRTGGSWPTQGTTWLWVEIHWMWISRKSPRLLERSVIPVSCISLRLSALFLTRG